MLKFREDFELSKYRRINTINITIKKTRIVTAIKILNDRIIPERMSPTRAQSPEKILFRDKRSAYSEGSALFMI